jgi:hypothetical protein
MKKQTLAMMEQSRKASEREKIALQQAKEAIAAKDAAVSEAEKATTRENSMLELMIEASADMLGMFFQPHTASFFLLLCLPLDFLLCRLIGSVLDAAAEDERVNVRTNLLVNLSLNHGCLFWATPERTQQIVRFQDRACQVREFLNFCTRTLTLVYKTLFPRDEAPETLLGLMEKFRDAPRIHNFVRAQLTAGARFAMIMIHICHPKLDLTKIVADCLAKKSRRKNNIDSINEMVTPVAEAMMDELLRMDSEFFVKGTYAEHKTTRGLSIDSILGLN